MPSSTRSEILIGTAGWTIPAPVRQAFPEAGTHLERYSSILRCAEINSSFHRPHRATTYARWRASVPRGFRFSVKLPRTITHKNRLVDVELLLDEFLEPVRELGDTLGCLLVQLPPSLAYDPSSAEDFFGMLRARYSGEIACEPRHATWLERDADDMLRGHSVARVAADPDKPQGAAAAGGYSRLRYYRLHGSPRMYYSSYEAAFLADLSEKIGSEAKHASTIWCIFDNTTLGEAMPNALDLRRLLEGGSEGETLRQSGPPS